MKTSWLWWIREFYKRFPRNYKKAKGIMSKHAIVHMTSDQFWQLIEMKLCLPEGVYFVGNCQNPQTHLPTSRVIIGGPGLPDWCKVAPNAEIRCADWREENHRLVLIEPN